MGVGGWPQAVQPVPTWEQLLSLAFRDGLHSGWSGAQGDSASSSDETSSANGDSLFSMFSGPDLVAAVKQRRYEEIPKSQDRGAHECDPQFTPLGSSGALVPRRPCVGEAEGFFWQCLAEASVGPPHRLTVQVT